jgi:hypothetical protein
MPRRPYASVATITRASSRMNARCEASLRRVAGAAQQQPQHRGNLPPACWLSSRNRLMAPTLFSSPVFVAHRAMVGHHRHLLGLQKLQHLGNLLDRRCVDDRRALLGRRRRLLLARRARIASGTATQCTRRNDSPPPPHRPPIVRLPPRPRCRHSAAYARAEAAGPPQAHPEAARTRTHAWGRQTLASVGCWARVLSRLIGSPCLRQCVHGAPIAYLPGGGLHLHGVGEVGAVEGAQRHHGLAQREARDDVSPDLQHPAQRLFTQRLSTQRLFTQRLFTQRLSTQRLSTQRLFTQRLCAAVIEQRTSGVAVAVSAIRGTVGSARASTCGCG